MVVQRDDASAYPQGWGRQYAPSQVSYAPSEMSYSQSHMSYAPSEVSYTTPEQQSYSYAPEPQAYTSELPRSYHRSLTLGSADVDAGADMSQYVGSSPSYSAFSGEAASSGNRQSFRSEPLSRYGSSEGSCHGPSTPASPITNTYFTLQGLSYNSMDMDTAAAYEYPYDTSLDLGMSQGSSAPVKIPQTQPQERPRAVSGGGRDLPVLCLHPDCDSKPFKRRADYDRHFKHRHAPESAKDAYFCDYSKCTRRREPFRRRDHFRDHLREFHKEDIEKRGGVIKEEWFEGRYMPANWWRCPKCLKRIYIDRYGYDCPTCKTSCQPKRQEARSRD